MLDRGVAELLDCPWDSPTVNFHVVERERNKSWVRLLVDTDVFHVLNEVGKGSGVFSRNCLTGASCRTVHLLGGFCLGSSKTED